MLGILKVSFAIGIESPPKHSGFVVFKIVAILRFSMSRSALQTQSSFDVSQKWEENFHFVQEGKYYG